MDKHPVLVIGAHPDDEILGCGGTIARLAGEGHEVYVTVLGEGVTSRYGRPEEAETGLIMTLQENCLQASTLVHVKDVFTFNGPDNRFDTIPLLDLVKVIEGILDRVSPRVIYTHHGGDLNIDHRIVFQAVLTATRPVPGQSAKEIYTFEVPSSTDWSFQRFDPPFRPNVFMDISDTLDLKLKALSCYEGELRSFPHPRSIQAVEAAARRWGGLAGCEASEAFELIRAIR